MAFTTDYDRRAFFARKDRLDKLGVRTYRTPLPEGPYLLELVHAQPLHQTGVQGHTAWELTMQVLGTNRVLVWKVVGGPQTKWIWGHLADDFQKLDEAVGRIYVAMVGTFDGTRGPASQVKDLLAEVED